MSSSSFNVIRRSSYDKIGIYVKELTQQLATNRSKLEGSQLETDDIRSQGRMDHSTIKLNDERLSFGTVLSALDTDFYYELPNEPDLDKLRVWFMLDHLGAKLRDMSGFGNDAVISGHPTLRRALLNLGFQQLETSPATPVMLFNSGTDVVSQTDGEYINIPDNESIQFSRYDTGFSLHFRFNCSNFSSHYPVSGGSYSRRFASKTDDMNNGWNILVYPTGTTVNGLATHGGIEVEIKDNGVEYARRTVGYTAGFWYQVVVTYDPQAGPTAADRIKIYTGGFENSVDSTFGTILIANTDLRIGARSSDTGFFHGYIHDFRLWLGKVLTQQEVTNINQNELTIENIPKGHSFIVQYALIQAPIVKKTHKWQTTGRIIKIKSHRYTVIELVISPHSHLYNMLERIIPLRTHKFTIVELVIRLLTLVYNQGGKVVVPKTHKFSLKIQVIKTKTHIFSIGTGLQTQYQRFQKSTTAGSNITQEITYSSTPQAIIVWSTGSTADNTFSDQLATYYGFSDGIHHGCISGIAKDNLSDTDTFSGHKNNKVISMVDNTLRSVVAEATVAFSTNKATFTWTTNDNRAVYIHTMAIWGVDNIEVKNFTTGTSSSGNKVYTLNNSTMTPTTILTLTHGDVSGWGDTTNAYALGIGAARSSTKQFSIGNVSQDSETSSILHTQYHTDHCLVALDDNDGTIDYSGKLSSFGQGAFTLNYTNSPSSTSYAFSVLAMDSPNTDIGVITQPAATGAQNITTATNVDSVRGVMLFSNGQTSTTQQSAAHLSIGAASSVADQGLTVTTEVNNASTTASVRLNKTGSVIKTITANATAASSTTQSEAAISALGTDQFTLNWSIADATARKTHYIVFGG